MNAMVEAVVTIALAVIGLAIVSVLVSNKANTTSVVQSLASGFGNSLGVAESPVTGASATLNLSYPTSQAYGFGSSQ
jgi:hypothetical protein